MRTTATCRTSRPSALFAVVLLLFASVPGLVLPAPAGATAHAPKVELIPPSPSSVLEGDTGTVTLQYTVELDPPTTETIVVDWAVDLTQSEADAADLDGPTSGSVSFAAGELEADGSQTPKTFVVTIKGDTDVEPDEDVVVSITPQDDNQVSGVVGSPHASRILTDEPRVTVAPAQATEGENVVFTVSLVDAAGAPTPAATPLTLEYSVASGTATDPEDFTSPDGSAATGTPLEIPEGQTSGTITVPTVQDTLGEADETFTLNLDADPDHAVLWDGTSVVNDLSATGTILDDEPRITVHHSEAIEGHSGFATLDVTVSVSEALGSDVTLDYVSSDSNGSATEGTDYLAASGQVTIPAGSTADQTVGITMVGDASAEPDEAFEVTFSVAAADLPDEVRFENEDGVVDDGADPVTATSTATILDDDTITITLGTAQDTDDDGEIDRWVAEAIEGGPGDTTTLEVPVRLDPEAGSTITLEYDVGQYSGAPVDAEADDATDFEPTAFGEPLTVTIPPGATDAVLPVTVIGDDVHELDEELLVENVSVSASGASDVRFDTDGDGAGDADSAEVVGRILDDDPVPTLLVDDLRAPEGPGPQRFFQFDVRLSNPTYRCLDDVVTGITRTGEAPDAATPQVDYLPIPNPNDENAEPLKLSFAAGEVNPSESGSCGGQAALVTVYGDDVFEPDESFELVLKADDRIQLPNGLTELIATGMIVNDDGPRFTISDIAVPEGNSGTSDAVFTLTVLDPGDGPVSVDYATEDVSGAAGTDYLATSGTLEVPAGEGTTTISVPIIGNEDVQPDRQFLVRLSNPVGATIVDDSAVATIEDDDDPGRPVAEAGGPYDGVQGEAVTVDGSGSTDPDGTVVSYSWDFGDGTPPLTSPFPTASHTYAEPGDYQITLTVTDDDDKTDSDLADLAVANAPPTVVVAGDTSVEARTLARFSAAATYTGTPPVITWDFGDGSEPAQGETATHAFAAAGTYTVTATATDPEGASGQATHQIEVTADVGEVGRVWGDDRKWTAIWVSRLFWPDRGAGGTSASSTRDPAAETTTPGAPHAVLATSQDFPDALAGGALAALLDAPILLNPRDQLDPDVAGELERRGVRTVWLLGGGVALSKAVGDELSERGYDVVRFNGQDRFHTAALVATSVGANDEGEVVVALGRHADPSRDAWPDALSAGALAAVPDALPVLLTRSDTLPEATADALRELGATRAYVVGGEVAIAPQVVDQLAELGLEVVRLAGDDRYGSSVAVATEAIARHPGGLPSTAVFARGTAFPDGLPAGALAARRGALLVLVPSDDLSHAPAVTAFLGEHAHGIDEGLLVGGPAAVSDQVLEQLNEAIRAP